MQAWKFIFSFFFCGLGFKSGRSAAILENRYKRGSRFAPNSVCPSCYLRMFSPDSKYM